MRKSSSGFTIVELLIVVVVIAILAAISLVAYNGIQQRARDAQMLSDLTNAAKKFELYAAEKGSYPYNNAQMITAAVQMSFSPVGGNVLSCTESDGSGYAIYARYPSTTKQYRIVKGGVAEAVDPALGWSSATLCAATPYSLANWGAFWVIGG